MKFFIVSLYFLLAGQVAHAYIDPGTGSMLLQIIIGTVLSIFVAGRKYLVLVLKKVFYFKKTKDNKEMPADPTVTGEDLDDNNQ